MELDSTDVEPYIDRAYKQVVRRANIPGFRKGKAPRRIIEQMYGREYLLNEAMDALVQEVTSKAVEDEDLEIGGIPSVSIDQFDPPSFTATVPLVPSVELGDLSGISVDQTSVEIDEARVDAVLDQFRSEQAVYEPADGDVEMDDLLTLTVVGWVDDDGERREIVRSENTDYIPRPGGRFPVPGFDEGLVGLPQNEQRTYDVEVPDDFETTDLAGKTAHFEATVHGLKRRVLPELTDEFAKSVGDGYESLKDLRDRVRGDLSAQEERNAKARVQEEALTKVMERATIAMSPLIIDHEIDHYVEDQAENIRAGRVSFEEYQEFLTWQAMQPEEIRVAARPKVEERLKRAHVLRKIVTDQGFDATDEDVDAEIDTIANDTGDQADEVRALFNDPERRESIRRVLINRKALDYLSGLAEAAPKKAPAKKRAAAKAAGASTAAKKATKPAASPKSGGAARRSTSRSK